MHQERDRLVAFAAKLDATIEAAERDLHEQSEKRRAAIEHFRAFVGEGLLRVAAPEVAAPATDAPWAPEPTVRLARAVDQALVKIDDGDGAWTRHQRELHNHFTTLAAALSRHGHDASVELRDDLMLIRIVFQSRRCDPDELAERIDGQVQERQSVLDHKERELLETYLIDEVAAHLQQMISAADRQVADMNEEIESRPTSTGMRLRILWRPVDEGEQIDGVTAPAGLAEVRKRLLRQVTDAWSPADRRLVGEFLQRRIQAARDADEGGSLVEILERALDYRVWHRFVVQRWQGGRWQSAYGPASGGERALAITIPLFAAAASHYRSAPHAAPRMIMLDEVFAGIDDRARASCMGLLAEFDLDVMMTSEREWGCYSEVPGLAIANLVRRDDLDAVFVTRWSWDGRRRQRETSELPPVEPEADTSSAGEGQEELF